MAKTVKCVKLGQDLPAIDPESSAGGRAVRMCRLVGGQAMTDRVLASVSQQAWDEWTDHMRMILNEYRLDPTADETNETLRPYMESFFFGEEKQIDNWVPEQPAQ